MIYVALLRGINVGGNNKVDMKELKQVFSDMGFQSVTSYINSGNVVFSSEEEYANVLQKKIETILEEELQFKVVVLVKSLADYEKMMEKIPDHLENNKSMRTDVLHLFDTIDSENILKELPLNEDVDKVFYVPGAVIWSLDRDEVKKSKLSKIIGTPIYKEMTIRNINTTRKLYEIMKGME